MTYDYVFSDMAYQPSAASAATAAQDPGGDLPIIPGTDGSPVSPMPDPTNIDPKLHYIPEFWLVTDYTYWGGCAADGGRHVAGL